VNAGAPIDLLARRATVAMIRRTRCYRHIVAELERDCPGPRAVLDAAALQAIYVAMCEGDRVVREEVSEQIRLGTSAPRLGQRPRSRRFGGSGR